MASNLKFIIPVESINQNKGGVILYDPKENKILKQYVHEKKWKRCGWRGGKLFGDYLIATDWSYLHYFNVKKWEYEKQFEHNTFNDLHYVEVYKKFLYVVNTGIDAIEIFKNPLNPVFHKRIFVFETNKIFEDRDIDINKNYNQMMKVKPHSCHPNCISFDNKRIIVTCFDKKQRLNSGEVIELGSGKRLLERNYDCHDGIFNGDDFYLTWTRHATILKFSNLRNKQFPQKPDKNIRIGKRGWWRGMVINNNVAYIFASDGYKKRKITAYLGIINLSNGKKKFKRLPVVDGVHWDTIYQPNIYKGE